MRDLLELRDEIDQIDSQIVDLYERRMAISEEVAEYKIAVGKKVFDKQREVSKLETLSRKGTTPFLKHGIRELFEQIMSMSRKRQYQLLTEHGQTEKPDFKEVDHLNYKNAKIVFQGTEGAYSQLALNEYFGENADSYHVDTWRDAMEAIQNGEADYAVFPIENSSAGIVSENYDLMVEYNNYIVGEQIIKIEHCLLGVPGGRIEDIRTVYSHPQALMQCSEYLNSNKHWRQVSVANTAMAAKKVLEDGDKSQAAVASETAGQIYGLTALRTSINHNKSNTTRFIVVASRPIYQSDAKKVSICFELPHKSGTLYNMLGNFIFNHVNMVMIESRPIVGRNWEYRFFVDIEGNLSEAPVQNALMGISQEAAGMRILGNY